MDAIVRVCTWHFFYFLFIFFQRTKTEQGQKKTTGWRTEKTAQNETFEGIVMRLGEGLKWLRGGREAKTEQGKKKKGEQEIIKQKETLPATVNKSNIH